MLKTDQNGASQRLRVLDIEIDLASGTVWRGDEVLDLPDLSYRLLRALVIEAPQMIGKDDLIRAVWGDVVVSDETLMQRVRLLRQVLGDDGQKPRYIASVRGRGYRLVATVDSAAAAPRSKPFFAAWYFLAGVVVLAVLAFFGLTPLLNQPAPSGQIQSLAVLPLDDLSASGDYRYFADGMHEELLARLAAIEEVDVFSRTTVEQYRGSSASIPEIAAALDADGIVEGSVRVSDDRLRITVQLIDGHQDKHLWAGSFDEELTVENVFAIQERVANSIAEELQSEYRRQRNDSFGLPTTNIDAYNLYLLGRYQTFRQSPQNLALAVDYLVQATRQDPEFVEAWAALGWAYAFQGTIYGQAKPDTVYPLAREAALKALELNDQLGDAHSLYADILTWYEWQFELAEIEYRRTMALEPLNVLGYALFLSSQSRHGEAIALLEERLAAQPEDDYVRVNAAWNLLRAGRYQETLDIMADVHDHPDVLRLRGYANLNLDQRAAAVEALENNLREQGRGQTQVADLAYVYYRVDRVEEAEALLGELEAIASSGHVSSLQLAMIYFAAGDETRGYELLHTAVDNRERGVIFLNAVNAFSGQRDDPRYREVVERVGLPTADARGANDN